MLVVRDELDESTLIRCHRGTTRAGLGDDLEVHAHRCAWGDDTELPSACPANSNLRLADAPAFFVRGDGVADHTRDLKLLGRLDIEGRVETHGEVSFGVLCKETEEGLLEDGGGKRVGGDNCAVSAVGKGLHFEEADLVEAASEKVDGMAACRNTFGQGLVVLQAMSRREF